MRTIQSNQKSQVATRSHLKTKSLPSSKEASLASEKLSLNYDRLDPAQHGRIINIELSDEEHAMANDPNVKPFAHVSDSAAYVRKIRQLRKS